MELPFAKLNSVIKVELGFTGRHSENRSCEIVILIRDVKLFYQAEEYHQGYYKKNPLHHKGYYYASGRVRFLKKH